MNPLKWRIWSLSSFRIGRRSLRERQLTLTAGFRQLSNGVLIKSFASDYRAVCNSSDGKNGDFHCHRDRNCDLTYKNLHWKTNFHFLINRFRRNAQARKFEADSGVEKEENL